MTSPTLYLFDVDGTLVTTDGAGRRAYEDAFASEFGAADGLLDFSFAGLTDPILVRRGLEAAGREPTSEALESMFHAYLERLSAELDRVDSYRVHPGVYDILDHLEGRKRIGLGLGTGNLERGARLKLEPADLNDYFTFGGFGSDAESRADLLRAGARRGAAQLEVNPDACRIVVIGDTTRDIDAARAIGAECVAVNTGGASRQQLADADPDLLVETLESEEVASYLAP